MSGWIARGMTTPTPVSRGEFGVIGATRILALLKKHGIPATWFIPGHTLETYPEACLRVLEAGHEIGHHGWTHVPPASLSREQEEAELARANEQIKKLTRSEEHTSELQSLRHLVCRLLLEKKKPRRRDARLY